MRKVTLPLVQILLSGALVGACGEAPPTSMDAPNQLRKLRGYFSVGLTDAPIDDVKEVWVTIEAFDIRGCDSKGWTTLPLNQATPFELLSHQDNIASLVPMLELESGDICEFRIIVGDNNYVVTDEGVQSLKVPSSEVKFKGQVTIADGVSTKVVVDFDAAESLHATGNGKYILRPVIRIKDVVYGPSEGSSLPGHDFLGSNSFEVHPWTDEVFEIGGGSTLAFYPGSVEASTIFTVSRWKRPSEASIGEVYVFTPSYTFGVSPVVTLQTGSTADGRAVFLAKLPEPTLCQGTTCSASLPHFSPVETCIAFADLPTDKKPLDWYTYYIHEAACQGLVEGHSSGDQQIFKPGEPITRAELLKIVAYLAVQPSKISFDGEPPFSDVMDEQMWHYELVGWAHANELITLENGKFRPSEPVKRSEAAAMFVRASGLFAKSGLNGGAANVFADLAQKVNNGMASNVFMDVSNVNLWYYKYVYAMRDAGLMQGADDTNLFLPDADLSRAEAATIACRAGGHCDEVTIKRVPYQSQLEADCDPNNLCGFACTNMLTSFVHGSQPTVVYMQKMAQDVKGAKCPEQSDVKAYTAAAKGIGKAPGSYWDWMNYEDIKEHISQGTPVHLGLEYSEMGSYRCEPGLGWNDGHQVVVVGYSKSFETWTIHDPICSDSATGAYRRIPSDVFRRAVDALHEGPEWIDVAVVRLE